MADTQPTMTYPTEEQHKRWKEQAEDMDMSLSQFIQGMTEAGMKKFNAQVEPDETRHDLREQRNDLKHELEQARERINQLEDQLYTGERRDVLDYIDDHPEASFKEVVDFVSKRASVRVQKYLDQMEGSEFEIDENGMYQVTVVPDQPTLSDLSEDHGTN